MFQLIVPLAFVFALPPSGESSRLQLDFGLVIAPASDKWDDETTVNRLRIESAQKVSLTIFSRRVVDDDAPPALQPFLQRVARFSFTGSGAFAEGYFEDGTVRRDVNSFGIVAQADGYLGRYLYVGGSFGYGRSAITFTEPSDNPSMNDVCVLQTCSSDEQRLPFQVAAGVRLANTRLWATWGATAYQLDDADWRVGYWGHVGVRVYSVVHRHIELAGGWQLIQSGFGLDFAATFWLGRRLGLGFGAFYRQGNAIDVPSELEASWTVGGKVSGKWWLSRRWALALDFSPRFGLVAENTDPDPTRVSYDITLGLTFRP